MLEKITGAVVSRAGDREALWFLGDPCDVVISGEETGGAYALLQFEFRPGSGAPPHVHQHESEFFYVQEGTLEFHVGDKTLLAHAGDLVHVYPNEQHWFRNPTDAPTRALVGITPAKFVDFFREVGCPRTPGSTPPPMPSVETIVAGAAKYGVIVAPPA